MTGPCMPSLEISLRNMLRERDAEIKRLTAIIRSTTDTLGDAQAGVAHLKAEIERLRAALIKIENDCPEEGGWASELARAALGKETKKNPPPGTFGGGGFGQ